MVRRHRHDQYRSTQLMGSTMQFQLSICQIAKALIVEIGLLAIIIKNFAQNKDGPHLHRIGPDVETQRSAVEVQGGKGSEPWLT
jgi:hypothetical protein